jgi:hypothetical protein
MMSCEPGFVTNRDTTFGVSHRRMQTKFFKEYQVELLGRHSPGPGIYLPNTTQFNSLRHDSKSFTQEKRECPLVTKEDLIKGDLSPCTYNLQNYNTAIEKHKSIMQHFGTKAKRRIDVRLCKNQEAL